jgi:hypothetical protein
MAVPEDRSIGILHLLDNLRFTTCSAATGLILLCHFSCVAAHYFFILNSDDLIDIIEFF